PLADVELVVVVGISWKPSRIVVHARAEDSTAAQAYLDDLRRRGREAESYLRGRCLQVRGDHDDIAVTPIDVPTANRRDVIVSDAVWRELDLNVSALFTRRELLTQMGLGTNRGMLLFGPPGTGKSALRRARDRRPHGRGVSGADQTRTGARRARRSRPRRGQSSFRS